MPGALSPAGDAAWPGDAPQHQRSARSDGGCRCAGRGGCASPPRAGGLRAGTPSAAACPGRPCAWRPHAPCSCRWRTLRCAAASQPVPRAGAPAPGRAGASVPACRGCHSCQGTVCAAGTCQGTAHVRRTRTALRALERGSAGLQAHWLLQQACVHLAACSSSLAPESQAATLRPPLHPRRARCSRLQQAQRQTWLLLARLQVLSWASTASPAQVGLPSMLSRRGCFPGASSRVRVGACAACTPPNAVCLSACVSSSPAELRRCLRRSTCHRRCMRPGTPGMPGVQPRRRRLSWAGGCPARPFSCVTARQRPLRSTPCAACSCSSQRAAWPGEMGVSVGSPGLLRHGPHWLPWAAQARSLLHCRPPQRALQACSIAREPSGTQLPPHARVVVQPGRLTQRWLQVVHRARPPRSCPGSAVRVAGPGQPCCARPCWRMLGRCPTQSARCALAALAAVLDHAPGASQQQVRGAWHTSTHIWGGLPGTAMCAHQGSHAAPLASLWCRGAVGVAALPGHVSCQGAPWCHGWPAVSKGPLVCCRPDALLASVQRAWSATSHPALGQLLAPAALPCLDALLQACSSVPPGGEKQSLA